MSKDEKKNERESHTGSVVAEDVDLSLWLNRLWARNEPPERVELWQTFGRNHLDRGEMIHHEDFKPNEKLNVEDVNKLANEIMAAAQNDCDSSRREAWYQLAVIDRNRRASPLTRRIGALQPKRTYALARSGGAAPEGEDELLDAKNLELTHMKAGFDEVRWDKQRNDRVLGEALFLLHNTVQNQQAVIDRLFDRVVTSFDKMQEAEDRKVQRDIMLAKEKFKIDLMEEGMRSARNLLPGLFAGAKAGSGEGGSESNGTAMAKTYGSSPERILVDNFLNDCEKSSIDIALFGDFEERDGKLVQVRPGVFSVKQFGTLVGVRDGRLPVEALDELMPNSGHENAISEEQINKARDAGVTDGIGMALFEIVGLRQRAKEARNAIKEVHEEKSE